MVNDDEQDVNVKNDDELVVDITRVEDSAGFIGTVRYVGRIRNTPYVGVEWDEPSRGKHNGTLLDDDDDATGHQQLTTYFTTRHPTSGSFVKPAKLRTGRDLTMDVVYEKYVPLDSPYRVAGVDGVLGYVQCGGGKSSSSSALRQKPVELVGELHIRRYQQVAQLSSVALRRCQLRGIDPSFYHHLQHLVELDLAVNLFSSWQTSFQTCLRQFPQLQRLSLAYNRINDADEELLESCPADAEATPSSLPSHQQPQHVSLVHLNLQHTNIQSAATIHAVQTICPQLQELILAGNPLRTLHVLPQLSLRSLDVSECSLHQVVGTGLPPHLTLLNLDGNPDCWPDMATALSLPSTLETLQMASLDDNGSGTTTTTNIDHTTVSLPQLYHWLVGTNVRRLRYDHPSRLATIAHCPHLVILNGGMVRREERIAAGHYALRECDSAALPDLHWYWQQQLPDVTTTTSATSYSVDDLKHTRLVKLTFQCAIPEAATTLPLTRHVPRTVSMAALSKMVARHYGLDEASFRLYSLSNEEGFPEVLESLESVADDSQIMINDAVVEDDGNNSNTNSGNRRGRGTNHHDSTNNATALSLTEEKIRTQEEERNRFLEQQKRLR
jgi:CAP-Gly domain